MAIPLILFDAFLFINEGRWVTGDAAPLFAAATMLLLAIVFRNHRIHLDQGEVIIYGLSGREAKRIPWAEIVWVNIDDERGFSKGNEGWLCRVQTTQGGFTFADQLSDYEELTKILDKIARMNPSRTEINLRRSGDSK